MMPDIKRTETEQTGKLFGNHIVCLSCWERQPNRSERFINASAFIASVSDMWVVVTAGHILDQFQELIDKGSNLIDWHLDDTMGTHPISGQPMPFNVAERVQFRLNDIELGYDYGLIEITDHDRRLLERNGIIPITEMAWNQGMPESFDGYLLIGFPYQDIECTPDRHISRAMAFMGLDLMPEQEVPADLVKPAPRLYFRLPPNRPEAPDSLLGMSGGPIFGFKLGTDGLRYWLVGVQSAVAKNHPIAIACPTQIFFQFLNEQTSSTV